MKKNIVFIFAIALTLNLLPQIPQTSNAWTLEKKGNDTILIWFNDVEKNNWEKYNLPHAIHSKLVGRNTTILDIAKIAEKEEDNLQNETIVHKIQRNTIHERSKMLVKWERDNGYIDTEGEEGYNITPLVRRELLAEIDEEEEKTETFWWKIGKAGLKVLSFGVTFAASVYAIYLNKEKTTGIMQVISGAAIKATNVMSAISTGVEAVEATCAWSWRKSKKEEEIEVPPLQNLPQIPKGHKKVDVYSYGL